jgi:hypothetical protein
MNLEDTLTRSLHDHLDPMSTPRVDLEAVRRAGERRRAATTAGELLAATALVVGGVALATASGDDDRVVQPAGLPAMDFNQGARAWYDDARGELHLGGAAFDIGTVQGMDTQASATPWGVVWTEEDQSVRLLREDGSVEVLDLGVPDGRTVDGNVKFDVDQPRVGWLTRTGEGTTLTVRSLEDSDTEVRVSVPCEGRQCQMLALGGIDHDRVLVRRLDADQTLVLDLTDPDAGWATIDGFRAADVRNRVVLGEGTPPDGTPLGPDWRFVRAQGPESLLTFDGAHELYWGDTLRATDGGKPLRLEVPLEGTQFVNLDSDGSVLVAVMTSERVVHHDCDTATAVCEEFDRVGPGSGDPVFLGNDM